jgi:Zn-dependent protease with chaperone function
MDIDRDPLVQPRSPRLNPFAFPSDTDFSFVLLVVTVVGVSIFYFFILHLTVPILAQHWTEKVNACSLAVFGKLPTELDFPTLDPSLAPAQIQCTALVELERAGWISAGVIGLLVLAGIIYWIYPSWIIRRGKLSPLTADDAPEVVAYLTNLCREIGLTRPPVFVWDPLNPAVSGLAFGRWGRYYVALSGGLVTRFYTDLPAFRAILLHELAHLKNADVDKSYFSVAIWPAFLLFVIVPYLIIMVGLGNYDILPSIVWYVATLAALVYLLRAAVLRSREFYADVRASTWDETSEALQRSLASLPQKSGRWMTALNVHPKSEDRLQTLADTGHLFRLNFWIAAGTGLSLSISLPLISQWLDLLIGQSWFPPQGSSFIVAGLFALLVMGVVGVSLWRAVFAAQITGKALVGIKRLAAGLTAGFVIGESVYFQQVVPAKSDALGRPLAGIVNHFVFELVWAFSLAVYLLLVFGWISSSARVWLTETAGMRSPRPVYIFGLVLAGGIFVWGVGPLFVLHEPLLGAMVISSSTEQIIALAQKYLQHPVSFMLLVTVWAFPMLAWLWRRRSATTSSVGWAFLGPASGELPRQELRPGLAVRIGLSAGLIYLVLQVVLRLFVRAIGLADTINRDQASLVWFFIAHVALAVLMQMVAAAIAAYLVKQTRWAHGLLAAFIGGCTMTIEFLAVNLLFGGGLDPYYVWLSLSDFVNVGAVASIPVVLGLSTIFNRAETHRLKTPRALAQVRAN